MAAKKAKLEDQFENLAGKEFKDATDLFKGIAIFVNGYTSPCADELKRLMMAHGGIYHTYQRTGSTTHLIASNLPYTKIIHYRKHKNPLPLCKPEWITDSITANKLLDWRPYLLYNSTSVTQPELQFKNKNNETTIEDNAALPGPSGSKISSVNSPGVLKNNLTTFKPSNAANGPLSSKNEAFLTEFYNNSRLHHIATMGATFKEYVNELRAKNTGSFPGLERLKKLKSIVPAAISNDSDSDEDLFSSPNNKLASSEPVIMHIDMDCFFVSVGLRNKPELKGLPVAVTHAKGNKPNNDDDDFGSMAEIASCSYEARKHGLKNGMFLGQALKLCPNLKTIKYDFEGYKEVSYNLYNIVASYTLDIEAVSCDEMYADISNILRQCNLENPLEFAASIRAEIKAKTGCPVSTGFGCNKLQARLATKQAKPDGQFYLKNKDIQAYIGSIGVRDIPGVGYTTMQQLKKMNVKICSELQEISLGVLQKEFGKKTGEMLYNTCRGIDLSKLNIEHVRKSVSTEVNYGIRFESNADAREFLKKLAKEVCNRLMKINAKGRSITLKLMVRAKDAPLEPAKFMGHGHCDNFTKSKNFLTPIDDEVIITREVLSLWELLQQPAHEIRGIGIQISRLETLKKQADTYMMKFIAKAAQNTEVTKTKQETLINPQLSAINNNSHDTAKNELIHNNSMPKNLSIISNNNRKNIPKKTADTLNKPQGLKAFFTAKKSVNVHPKAGASHFPSPDEIDKAVLSKLPEDIKLEILKFHKNNPPENNLKPDNNHQSADEIIPTSQAIDESVLTELPEDIRNEILASKPILKKTKVKKTTRTAQEPAENYFKHTKPGIFSKPKLPEIKELDMAVLIELPDAIRNEILDHYKSNRNNENPTDELGHQSTTMQQSKKNNNPNNKYDELNVSFSQVDPDFLAALTEDLQKEVKHYCTVKKAEKKLKLNKTPQKEAQIFNINFKAPNLIVKNKRSCKTKNIVLNNVKNIQRDNFEMLKDKSFLENEINILENKFDTNDKRESIKLHLLDSSLFGAQYDEHQEMLGNLVNYLFSLPMQQVRKIKNIYSNTLNFLILVN